MKTKIVLLLMVISTFYVTNAQIQKIQFGDLKARHIGPALMSGRITDLENHPTNSRIIYAGTAGGGVWKSNDGGVNFNSIFDDYCQSIGSIEIDPNDPDNTIYVGTGEIWTRNSVSVGDGLYKSTDGGSNWKKIGFENSERIANIIVNPKNSKEIYVAVLGALWGDSEERGLYKTSDGGKSWNKILYTDAKTGCADLAMDPNNSNILYASMWQFRRTGWSFNSGGNTSALYKSTDGGKSWNKIHNGFPKGDLGRLAIAIAPSNTNILYTVIETKEDSKKGLYRSDDAGKSWKQLNNDFDITVRPFYFSRIVVDPKNENIVIKGGVFGSISKDGGKTFKSLGHMHPDIHDIVFDINNSDRMYVGTDGGVYRSLNGGTSMEIIENLPVSQFYHISVDNKTPYNIYGGLQDNGSWFGPSSSPNGINPGDWTPIGGGDGFRVLRHPTKDIIYSEMQGAENVWQIDIKNHKSKTIQPLAEEGLPKFRFNWNTPIAISENQPDRLYIGSQFLHKSEDMGNTWKIISPDLTTNNPDKQQQDNSGGLSKDNSGAENHTTIFTIAESPLDENVIWVGTDDGNVQVTQNGGKTWTNTVKNIQGLPKNTWCYHIEASNFNKGTAYAVFDGHTMNDKTPYAYKTTDFGKTWKSIISKDIIGFVRNIQEDYVNEELLFLGTEFGLYITVDGGENWTKFKKNMPSASVHFIALQKQTNDLVMGTHGRGVIIIDDISILREMNTEMFKEKVYFFKTKPYTINENTYFKGYGGETQFVGQNPSKQPQIKYYLSKRHTFGKMSLEIQDNKGNVLSELPPGKNKGINIVKWNYNMKVPKIAKGKNFTYEGFATPNYPAGIYNVVLKKGKNTYKTTIELVYDKTSKLSLKDREFKHNTIMKLYDMNQELAYMVYEMDAIIKYAKDTNNTKINKKLDALKNTLVITTGDNYVNSSEKQLREKLTYIYSRIISNYDKPTSTELKNVSVIEKRFLKAKKDYQKIKKKIKFLDKLELKTYKEFIK